MNTEIDAADVLSSYSSILWKGGDDVVRNVDELPYSKETIKTVLAHCIKLSAPGSQRQFLQSAYIALADFQPLSDDERATLQSWKGFSQTDSKRASDDDLLNLAKRLSKGARPALDARKRVSEEAAGLVQELKLARLWD